MNNTNNQNDGIEKSSVPEEEVTVTESEIDSTVTDAPDVSGADEQKSSDSETVTEADSAAPDSGEKKSEQTFGLRQILDMLREKGIIPGTDKTKKKSWRYRSVVERLITLIPFAIIFYVFMFTETQMIEQNAPYTMEFYFSLTIVAASLILGIFCIRLGKIPGWIITAATPFLVYMLTEYIVYNPFGLNSTELIYTNLVFYYGTAIFILGVTGSMKAAVVITTAVPMVFGIANYYTLEFRGTPVFPWDIASVGIAADVAGNYEFTTDWHICFIICSFVFLIFLGAICTTKIRIKKWWFLRAPIALIAAFALVTTGAYVQSDEGVSELKMYPYLFTPHSVYKRNGAAVTFAYTLQYTGVQKPDGYSAGAFGNVMDGYEAEPVDDDAVLPNVIVIMNEAFSDLTTAAQFEQFKEITPYINSLTENTVKGTAHVSIKGGNTANSEFEFLTGLSMTHFAPGSIPYQQHLKGETPSLASQLSELGYSAVAIHPYGRTGWNRETVYEWFGFDSFLSQRNFGGYEKIRSYYSDAATYKKIRELYESKEDGQPMFVFDVTMQNHGGYTTGTYYPSDLYVKGLARTGVTNIYLALMNKSDTAFGELVEYFKTQEEPTIILMFGDHQPNDNVVTPLWKITGTKVETGTLDEQLRRYTVPFVITANYDIEEETDVNISLNYLASMLCEKAGIPRTAAQMYLSELYESYPVITAGHYSDAEGNFYDASTMEDIDAIKDYGMMAYNIVADRKNTLWDLFKYN